MNFVDIYRYCVLLSTKITSDKSSLRTNKSWQNQTQRIANDFRISCVGWEREKDCEDCIYMTPTQSENGIKFLKIGFHSSSSHKHGIISCLNKHVRILYCKGHRSDQHKASLQPNKAANHNVFVDVFLFD